MKNLTLTLLISCFLLNASAGVKTVDNPKLSKQEKKVAAPIVKRVANFYGWYLNFLNTNKTRPLHHAVIDQNTSKQMHEKAASNITEYDEFLASDSVDEACTLEIMPSKVEKDNITIVINVIGKYNYHFEVDMKVFKENWCIDKVLPVKM